MVNPRALTPESRDREGRMRALVEASLELFAADGYANVSTRRIADLAGCSETLLFRYFGGKRGLLVAICGQLMEDPGAPEPRATDPEDLPGYLRDYIVHVCRSMRDRAKPMRVLMAELINDPGLAADFARAHERAIALLEDALGRFRDSGVLSGDTDLRAVAVGIEGMAFSLSFVEELIYGHAPERIEEVATTMAGVLADGLRPAAQRAAGLAGPASGPSIGPDDPDVSGERLDRAAAAIRDAIATLEELAPPAAPRPGEPST